MLSLSTAIAGVVAVAATLSAAVHFEQAPGSRTRLTSVMLQDYGATHRQVLDHGVNRAVKAGRLAMRPTDSVSRTVALTIAGLPDTLVLVRMPFAANNGVAPRPPAVRAPQSEGAATARPVACDLVASILTDAGRSGVIGRCIT